MPSDLPSFNLSEDPSFIHTGIDFAGPMYLGRTSAQDAILQRLT